jgi:hypothetical protein
MRKTPRLDRLFLSAATSEENAKNLQAFRKEGIQKSSEMLWT